MNAAMLVLAMVSFFAGGAFGILVMAVVVAGTNEDDAIERRLRDYNA
jgi:hypothetical protein